MEEKEKKPIYKKWWFWLIVVVLVFSVFGAIMEDDEEATIDNETGNDENIEEDTSDEKPEEVEKEEPKEEQEELLTQDEVDELENTLEELLEEEREFGEVYYLDSYEFEDDMLKVRLEMRQDPLPTKEDIMYNAESTASYMDSQIDGDVPIRVTVAMKIDGGYAVFGHASLADGKVKFKEDDAMQIFE